MSHLPAQTSYFSITTFLSSKITTKTAIALDIVHQYHELLKSRGENIHILAVQGYGEHITFEEACLGTWMVFDKLFGIYPVDIENIVGTSLMGWNEEVTDPTIDIPIALKLFDDLSAPAASYEDKWTRMEAIQKHFYRNYTPNKERRFITTVPQTYTMLETLNPSFYNWILKNLDEIDNAISAEFKQFNLSGRRYLFDIRPEMGPGVSIIHFNKSMILANKFFSRFLTIFEQVLYAYTKQIFPLKLYATIAYLFNVYMKIIVDFLKPYHAKMLEKNPSLRFGDDIFDSVVVGNRFQTQYTTKLFDYVYLMEEDPSTQYDDLHKIREMIGYDLTQKLIETITYTVRLDASAFRWNERSITNTYFLHNEYQIYTQGPKSYTFTGESKVDWNFWVPYLNYTHDLDVLTWDKTTQTVTNTWDRDIILIAKEPVRFESTNVSIPNGTVSDSNAILESITAESTDALFAFGLRYFVTPVYTPRLFDVGDYVDYYDYLKEANVGTWYVYKNNDWRNIHLPANAVFDSTTQLHVFGNRADIELTLAMTRMMTQAQLSSITSPSFKMGYFWPAVFLPVGGSFTRLTANFLIRQKVYPFFDIVV